MTKSTFILTLISLVMLCSVSALQIQNTNQKLKYVTLVEPVVLYDGGYKGQTVLLNYANKLIGVNAVRIELLNSIEQGNCGALKWGWVKVSNSVEFHFNRVKCHTASSETWDHFSESFVFPVTQDKSLTFETTANFKDGHYTLFLTGYYTY